MTTPTTLRGQALRRFVRHYLEMVAAMVAGMAMLGLAESMLLNRFGWAELRRQPEVQALAMATSMTVAMAAWMRFRGHGWGRHGGDGHRHVAAPTRVHLKRTP